MNNSVFGETMENIENRVDIRLIEDEIEAKKLAVKPNFDHCTIFDEKLVAIHMKRTKLYYNKPIYLEMCILDLSKTLMFDFHYTYIKPKYGDKVKLLYTDTDSLMYEIETEDFYRDTSDDAEARFDTSDFDKDHPSGIPTGKNKKKLIGMMKDEAAGKIITEFAALTAKQYSYRMDGEDYKKCKGVKKNVVKKGITHEDFLNCLFTNKEQMKTMNIIRSRFHNVGLFTETVNKVALSANDDKRVVMEDKISTLAIGHYKAEKI